jgi:ornithine cyclodeaminase
MAIPFVDTAQLTHLLSMVEAIDALETAFGSGEPRTDPPRQHVEVPGGELLLMPASAPDGTGVKLITVAPSNPARGLPLINGVYVLFSPDTLQPAALFDGAGLTRLRTAAVSGVATRHLAREDAHRLVVFGEGVQGRAHIEAMKAVRPITSVTIVERESGDATAVAEADIVCTCTTSSVPVFDGGLLSPGTHVNAIGAHQPTARELDDRAISAGRLVVDTVAAAGAGDLRDPLRDGVLGESDIEDLADVVRGKPRASAEEITIFKSVGVAFEDLVVAIAALEKLNA